MNAIRKLIARGYYRAPEGEGHSGGGEVATEVVADPVATEAAKTKTDDLGKPKPSDSEAKLLKEVMDKKGTIKTMGDQLEQVKAALKAFEGLDPVAMRALATEAADRATKGLEEKGAWDALKKQLVDTHAAESGLTKAELSKAVDAQNSLNTKIAELTVGVSFGQSKFLSEDMSDHYSISKMRKLFGGNFEFDGEKVVGYDKPLGEKDRTVLMDAKGDALPFDAAMRKLVEADEDRDSMLKSKSKPGAGSKTEPKGKVVIQRPELTGRNRIAASLKVNSES